jgi:hypothetical protein
VSGGVSGPAGLLRRLRFRGGGAVAPASEVRTVPTGALGSSPGGPAVGAPGTRAGAGADAASTAAAMSRATAEAGAEALAAPDPDLARERAEAEDAGQQRTGGVPLVPGSGRQAGRLRGARALAAAARAGAEALADPDPDLERERAETAAALAAEACGGFGPSSAPERHRKACAASRGMCARSGREGRYERRR